VETLVGMVCQGVDLSMRILTVFSRIHEVSFHQLHGRNLLGGTSFFSSYHETPQYTSDVSVYQ
jgi:hypothetical protein